MSELPPNRTNSDQLPDYLNLPQGLVVTDLQIKATSRKHGEFNPVGSSGAMTPDQMRLYLAAPTVARLGGWGRGLGGWDEFVRYSQNTTTTRAMAVGGMATLPPDVTTAQYLAGGARTRSPVSFGVPAGLATLDLGLVDQKTGVVPGYSVGGTADFGMTLRRKDATGALTAGADLSSSGDLVMRDNSAANKGGLAKGRVRLLGQTGSSATSDPPPAGFMDVFHDTTTGHASRVDSSGVVVDLEGGGGLPPRYVSGLVIRYASTSTVTVSPGKARNKANTADMALASQVTVSTTSAGVLGYETKTLTGTASFTGGSPSVTGSGTKFLTEFAPSNTRRALTGTISSSGGTVTGTGTKFLSEVHAGPTYAGGGGVDGDLIGTAAKGFWQVVSVDSDTSLTISLSGGASDPGFSSDAPEVIECPQIGTAGGKRYQVERITSDTALRAGVSSVVTTETGVAVTATAGAPNPDLVTPHWRSVWLVAGTAGTTVVLSTQRTAPLCVGSGTVSPANYDTSYRRIGWVMLDGSSGSGHFLREGYGQDGGHQRQTTLRDWQNFLSNVNAPNAGANYLGSCGAPPTARRLQLTLLMDQPNTPPQFVLVSRRNTALGVSFNYELGVSAPSSSTSAATSGMCACDGAQGLTYRATPADTGDGFYLIVNGYEDTLE